MAEENKDVKIIDLRERVRVYATKDAPYHEEGQEVNVAPAIAEMMIKNKWATKTKGSSDKK